MSPAFVEEEDQMVVQNKAAASESVDVTPVTRDSCLQVPQHDHGTEISLKLASFQRQQALFLRGKFARRISSDISLLGHFYLFEFTSFLPTCLSLLKHS